jgi:hypothetical protein
VKSAASTGTAEDIDGLQRWDSSWLILAVPFVIWSAGLDSPRKHGANHFLLCLRLNILWRFTRCRAFAISPASAIVYG